MTRIVNRLGLFVIFVMALSQAQLGAQTAAQTPARGTAPQEGDFVIHNFHFQSGETMPDVYIHYTTFGTPVKDAHGHTTNAVLLLHGTSGTGNQFLRPQFAGVLFERGQLLDIRKYYIIMPDNIGHGKSSKPSNGMRAHFPWPILSGMMM